MEIRRPFTLDKCEFRAASEEERAAKAGDFFGHAAVFNQPTIIGGRGFGFVEMIARGAFDNVLDQDVRFLVNHEGLPLARTVNGSLFLTLDHFGLRNDAQIAPTALGRDVATLLQRGDINEQSFAFTVQRDAWYDLEDDKEDAPFPNDGKISDGSDQLDEYGRKVLAQAKEWGLTDLRVIRSVETLYDVSVVTFPAYPGAKAGIRQARASEDEIERALREVRSGREVEKAKNEAIRKKVSFMEKYPYRNNYNLRSI